MPSMRIDGSIPVVRTDRIALHEIVANLVDNALKYSEPGSTVEVESALESGALVIRVRDRGDGIPAGDLPRIFDRFTQLDGSATRAHGGVGLGLHLVRELSRRLGGDVAVDSVVGRGTVFTVTIPVTSATSDRDPEQSELSSA